MRAYKKNQELLALQNRTFDDPSSMKAETIDQLKPPTYSFTLSTEMCMIIHGTILASLFVIAISR